jgi:hypothetical protein
VNSAHVIKWFSKLYVDLFCRKKPVKRKVVLKQSPRRRNALKKQS